MAFKLGPINLNAMAQGVGGLVFGSGDRSSQEDDCGVEQLLERVSNGVRAEDRRAAMEELRDVLAENQSAQLALGAMGLPLLMSILREERNDLDLVRGTLETLVNALSTTGNFQGVKNEVQPGLMNSELLSREPGSVSLILSLLEEEDFYVRYYTVQLLTALLANFSARLQEAILATPQGITRLMDMMQDREVIRNEALLLLTYLTRAAEEIQKIVVFEGAFEKVFNIIHEEGGPEGGIVVQDCLELLNNLLRNNPSNQIFLRETLGLQHVVSLLKVRKGGNHGFPQQKTINLLCALETVALLLAGGSEVEPGKDANVVANQTVLAQKKLLDYLLSLSLEGRIPSVAVRCAALRCIGDLVLGHPGNRDLLGSKITGEEPDAEPALHCILRLLLFTSNLSECIAAEYVFKCFCEDNPDGQTALASTITPLPQFTFGSNGMTDNDSHVSFGSMLIHALTSRDGQNGLEASCRAASVLTHILKDNVHCKERVLQIPLEIPESALASPDVLMARCMRYLAAASQPFLEKPSAHEGTTSEASKIWLQPILLRLLVTWLADCSSAVATFLETPAHLTYLVELISSSGSPASIHVAGLAAVLLGECIVNNSATESSKDGSMVVDVISQRVGLTTYFSKLEDLQRSAMFLSATSASRLPTPLTRSTAAAVAAGTDSSDTFDSNDGLQHSQGSGRMEPVVTTFYDADFVRFMKKLEPVVKERIVELFSCSKSMAMSMPMGFDKRESETVTDYIVRLRSLLQKQAQEMQELLSRNSALAEELVSTRGNNDSFIKDSINSGETNRHNISGGAKESFGSRGEIGDLRQQIQEAQHRMEIMNEEKAKAEADLLMYKQLAAKHEADLKSLSNAYNSLEQENYRLELEMKNLHNTLDGGWVAVSPQQLDAAREEGRQEAQRESEADLNDLLVCLGQEESKVMKLRTRLTELGEDVDALLEGIGDEGNNESDETEDD